MQHQNIKNVKTHTTSRRASRFLGAIALSVICSTGFAELDDLSVDDISDLSLDDLLNVDVSVASSDVETIPETAAIVTRYDAKDLSRMGLRTLKEFLSFIPGVIVHNSYVTSAVSIRGIFEATNQKVLFLLNGVPYFMPSHSDIPLLGVPLESIAHIEIIRGPGAVYHGTNASAGVINVVTKENQENVVAITRGSNGLMNSGFHGEYEYSDNISLAISAESQNYDGYDGRAKGTRANPFSGSPAGAEADVPRGDQMDSIMAKGQFYDFNFMAQRFKSEYKALGGFLAADSHTLNQQDGYLLHASFEKEIGNTNLKVYADRNQYYLNLLVENQSVLAAPDGTLFPVGGGFRQPGGEDNVRKRFGAIADVKVTDWFSLYTLVEKEFRSLNPYEVFNQETNATVLPLAEKTETREDSAALQVDIEPWDNWRFVLGGRYVSNDNAGKKFNPRLSVLFKLNEENSLKLLYSTGFNSPNFLQTAISAPGLLEGDNDLNAETVRSLDFVYTLFTKRRLFVVNTYVLWAKDFIERIPVSSGGETFSNEGDFVRSGIEFDYQYAFEKGKFFANIGYSPDANEVDSDDKTRIFAPNVTSSIGGIYQLLPKHGVGASLRYIGERADLSPIHLVNVDYRYTRDNIEIFATIKNLFDEDVEFPDITNLRRDASLVSEDGRSYLVGVKMRF